MVTDNIISSAVTLLDTNWNTSNTGGVKPNIANITELKRTSGDSVLLYSISEVPEDNAAGVGSKKKTKVIAMDCRSSTSFAQIILMKEEVERIMNANQVDPFSDLVYSISDITDIQDMSDRTRCLFRFKLDVKFEQFNITI